MLVTYIGNAGNIDDVGNVGCKNGSMSLFCGILLYSAEINSILILCVNF